MSSGPAVSTARAARVEFATAEWFEMFAAVVEELAPRYSDVTGRASFSEVYRHVPPEIAPHDGLIGWCLVADDGRYTYRAEPDRAADVIIEVDYAFARDMLQEYDASNAAERRERRSALAEATAAARFEVRGDTSRNPSILRELHDALAARTVQA